jgi:hypothetical protein
MKKVFASAAFALALSVTGFAQHADHGKQELNSKGEPVIKSKDNAPVDLKAGETIVRGEALAANVKNLSVEEALKEPMKYAEKTVAVEGVIVRSCKKEGCWMEMADKADGKSVRVTFGDHKFVIPLNSAGMKVKAQGVFKTKVLPKDHVDHLINDDGAKFPNRNVDGTVTEVSFDALGVVLTKN